MVELGGVDSSSMRSSGRLFTMLVGGNRLFRSAGSAVSATQCDKTIMNRFLDSMFACVVEHEGILCGSEIVDGGLAPSCLTYYCRLKGRIDDYPCYPYHNGIVSIQL